LTELRFEDWGKDSEGWADWYGARLDNASVTVTPTVPAPALTPIGMVVLVGLLSIIIAVSRIRRSEK
jgi:hypothetical protein